MKKAAIFFALAATTLLIADDIDESIDFLTSNRSSVGFTYTGSAGALAGKTLPLSYYCTPEYFAEYVGALPGNNMTVTDKYNPADYTLTPTSDSPGIQLQVERVDVYSGTDIYDGACWQIAMAVAAKEGKSGPGGASLFDIGQNQTTVLQLGYDGNATMVQANANRAITKPDGTFTYGGVNISTPNQAYFFRMIPTAWTATDPFMGTSYMKYITAQGLPPGNPAYKPGIVTWMDWKPITGENAWAFFEGPLQLGYLNAQSNQEQYIPFQSVEVQNAIDVLYSFACMQSEIGGVFYAAKGSLGNTGDQPVNPYEVSVENNASLLSGVMMLKQVLNDELQYETSLSSDEKATINSKLKTIDAMVNGGSTPAGGTTKGMLAFFQNYAWDHTNGIFYQGGLANDPSTGVDFKATIEPKAVDVNTWGITVIGQPMLDKWFGDGTAYTAWQNVKSWGGYYGPDGTLWGVGYSDEDHNGKNGNYKDGIISAEWTAGAINMVRALIDQYTTAGKTTYVTSLKADEASMVAGILNLRSDNYLTSSAFDTVRPPNYAQLVPIPSGKMAYMYASKRYMIPFGWFANPLPSTTSTSWAVMMHYNYNPFKLGGGYDPIQY